MQLTTQVAIVAVAAIAAVAGWQVQQQLGWFGGDGEDGATRVAAARPALEVELAPVRVGPLTVTVKAVGTARADEGVTLTPKVTGLVRRIGFLEGQWVEAGALLLGLDATALEAELAEARAALENAGQLHRRSLKLLKTRNVPQARVDELAAQLAGSKARVDGINARLGDYEVRAPFAGRLGMRNVSVGALIRPGDPITTLDDTRVIKLDFEVAETVLAALSPGLEVTAHSAAFPADSFHGRVVTIDSRVDPVTRSVKARARLPNPDQRLKPGMFLTVTLATGTKQNALLVPEEAILVSPAGHYLYAVEDGKAVRRGVRLGQRLGGEVEVLDGLDPGAEVVTGGVQKVRDGLPVRQRGTEPDQSAKS